MTGFDLDALRAAAAALPAPPCPWWCMEAQPHRWLLRDHAGNCRDHTAYVADLDDVAQVFIDQTEHSDDEPPSPIEIRVWVDTGLDAAQARRLAMALLDAAGKLDQIVNGQIGGAR